MEYNSNAVMYEIYTSFLVIDLEERKFDEKTILDAEQAIIYSNKLEKEVPSWIHALANGNLEKPEDVLSVAMQLYSDWKDGEPVVSMENSDDNLCASKEK